ncbi:MAG: DNA adenine methylase [Bacteroidota bacterium]|nr:DNA adenine methylase [Bacteroidota bacterium]
MNYIGSKSKLSHFIKSTIEETVGKTDNKVFAELFGGTGIIGRQFKQEVKKIIMNDVEPYSYVLMRNYIGNTKLFDYSHLIDELNLLAGEKGFIYQHYCMGGKSQRQYFSDQNGKKIDAIRRTIEQWNSSKRITQDQYYFLLASLLESADKVANTASVYGAFLKTLKASAQKEMKLHPAVFSESTAKTIVHHEDANELIKKISGDILYLDPPYNERQYGSNYHLLNTIALYDSFTPNGKTGLRTYYRSPYCQRAKVAGVFEDLIQNAKFKYIFLSYNNEGLLSEKTIQKIMSKYGSYSLRKKKYQRFKADKTEKRNHTATSTFEFLHILIKDK